MNFRRYFNHMRICLFMAACCISAVSMTACDESLHSDNVPDFEKIQTDIRNKKYANAIEKLEKIKKHSKSTRDMEIIEFNEAVVRILNGDCDTALKLLKKSAHFVQGSSNDSNSAQSESENCPLSDLHARIYEAAVTGILCPGNPGHTPSQKDYEQAVSHLYHIIQHGYDRRNLLGHIYTKMYPECRTFIPPEQSHNNTPEDAYAMTSHKRGTEFILCPGNGNWYHFDARKHEKLRLSMNIRPLEREFWLDDSSRLPYARIHVDLFRKNEDGSGFAAPVTSYVQPVPETPPTAEKFLSQNIIPPPVELQENGTYYVHFYTEGNGEAIIRPKFMHHINCDYIDDTRTYTKDLTPITADIPVDERMTDLFLCPKRPDNYTFELNPGQMAMFSIQTMDNRIAQSGILHIELRNAQNEKMRGIKTPEDIPAREDNTYRVFQISTPLPDEPDSITYTVLILVHNTTQTTNQYRLTLEGKNIQTGIRHALLLVKSHECPEPSDTPSELTFPAAKEHEITFLPPKWACPNTVYRYRPVIPDRDKSINAKILSNVISTHPLQPDDFVMETTLILPPDDKEYLGESAQTRINHDWITPHDIYISILQKPFLPNAQIRMKLSDEATGFILTQLIPPPREDQSREQSSKQEKKENKKQNSKRDQKSHSKEDEKSDPTPEKPSETPATPKGAGTDTQGRESTPTPNDAEDKNAHQFDPDQIERDHIDALLDSIEQGNFNIPLPGTAHETKPEKDW